MPQLATPDITTLRAAISAPPPSREPSGVAAALAPLAADILAAIRNGWTVGDLAKRLAESGLAYSAQSIAKVVDAIVDDALRAAINDGAKPVVAAKRVLGIDLARANAQVTARIQRRLTRLTPTRSAKSRGNRNA
jgi:hypothetical protein